MRTSRPPSRPRSPCGGVWKLQRDTTERGYEEGEDARAQPAGTSTTSIRPQAAHVGSPLSLPEGSEHSLTATVLLRPTIPHSNPSRFLTAAHVEAVALFPRTRDAGMPTDVIEIPITDNDRYRRSCSST
jgi:hypothetical protein